ncbi:MAG: hypothetical protein HQK84_02815 [Nitrospinae bacterium]|nr:hypothetical protein [Nitrospinota bacterium]
MVQKRFITLFFLFFFFCCNSLLFAMNMDMEMKKEMKDMPMKHEMGGMQMKKKKVSSDGHQHSHKQIIGTINIDKYFDYPHTKIVKNVGKYTVHFTTFYFQQFNEELSRVPYQTKFIVAVTFKDNILDFEFDNVYSDKITLTVAKENGEKIKSYFYEEPKAYNIFEGGHYFQQGGTYKVKIDLSGEKGDGSVEFPVEIKIQKRSMTPIYGGLLIILCFVFFAFRNRQKRYEK